MTTYQRLKAENAELKNMLMTLINKPDSINAQLIKIEWKMKQQIEQSMWRGYYDSNSLMGVIPNISKLND